MRASQPTPRPAGFFQNKTPTATGFYGLSLDASGTRAGASGDRRRTQTERPRMTRIGVTGTGQSGAELLVSSSGDDAERSAPRTNPPTRLSDAIQSEIGIDLATNAAASSWTRGAQAFRALFSTGNLPRCEVSGARATSASVSFQGGASHAAPIRPAGLQRPRRFIRPAPLARFMLAARRLARRAFSQFVDARIRGCERKQTLAAGDLFEPENRQSFPRRENTRRNHATRHAAGHADRQPHPFTINQEIPCVA